MQGHVYYYTHRVVNQVSERVVEHYRQGLQESLVVDELITQRRMSGEVGENAYRLNLNFLVLRCQDVKLNTVEDADPNIIGQQLFLGQIIEEYIGYAGDGVEYEFFADVERPFVDG